MSFHELFEGTHHKPHNHPSLEVEPLDVRDQPAVMNVADAFTAAAMPVESITATQAADRAAAVRFNPAPSMVAPPVAVPAPVAVGAGPVSAPSTLVAPVPLGDPGPVNAPGPVGTPIANPGAIASDGNAVRFPAADAAIAAARGTPPDAALDLFPAPNAIGAGRLRPGDAALPPMNGDNGVPLANQVARAPTLQQVNQLPINATIPATMPTTSTPLASPTPVLSAAAANRSPFSSDPFQAALAPTATPLPAPMAGAMEGMQPSVAEEEREPALTAPRGALERPLPPTSPDLQFAALPTEETAARPALAGEQANNRGMWPLAPAMAALYEVWYRGNRI